MTNDTDFLFFLRTQDIFALSLKHALMYSILYKHAVSTRRNYYGGYRQNYTSMDGLIACVVFVFCFFVLFRQTEKVRGNAENENLF